MARLVLLGVGAMRSPRFAPAGLLVEHEGWRVMLDGGPGASPREAVDAWLITDARAELFREIRALAGRQGLEPLVADFVRARTLCIRAEPVAHTSHPTFGYRIDLAGYKVVWAPEFFEFPEWAAGVDLLFADGAGWDRPIRFAGGVGGHACVVGVAREAQRHRVRRLVFAHIGRPSLRAMDAGRQPPFGELGHDGEVFELGTRSSLSARSDPHGRPRLPARLAAPSPAERPRARSSRARTRVRRAGPA